MSENEPRVRPPHDLEVEILDPLKKIFGTKARALLFAGVLGFHLGARKELTSYGEGIRLDYFDEDAKMIDIIAVAAKRDLGLLRDERRREAIEIFEEFAHGGLLHIREVCFTGHRSLLDGFFKLFDMDETSAGELPGLI